MVAEIAVELAYARPEKQTLLALSVPVGSTVHGVIQQSGILELYPELSQSESLTVGIWSRTCSLDSEVSAGDRVEIYRPLIADPKKVRQMRAERAKQEGRADKVTGGRVNPQRAGD